MLKMTDENFDVQAELEETQRAMREITLMIEQSQGEVSKLAQRNAAITAHLQQIQNQVEKTSAQDIRMAYDSALDAQQRLFVMRGQLEKLQSDKNHLEKYKVALDRLVSGTAADSDSTPNAEKSPSSGMEMIINAQEAERQRLSRLMHDGPAQAMSNFILQTEIAMRLLDVDAAQAKEELGNLKAAAMGTFQKVRNFIFELRPMMLDDLGLAPTLRKYVEAFKDQTGLDANLVITGGDRRIAPYLEVMIFRAVQELLGNTSRHSQATLVKIALEMGSDMIRVSVDDNGKGFDPQAVLKGNSLGLKLIRERTEMLGGTFIADSAVGKGARISFSILVRN
jgi:two-component system sensor histidine kinase DegS